MKDIKTIVENLHLDNQLLIDELPNIDLYMDQVIQIFESKLEKTKRNEDDKVLTKTMINNYAKGKLFFPIENKKYSKEHIMLIGLIYQLKGALSINDIKITLDTLNQKIMEESFPVETIYKSYLKLSERNVDRFYEDVGECSQEVTEEIGHLQDKDEDYLEQLLLIASLVNMSNFYRRLAEKLVDNLDSGRDKVEKAKKNKD
ncbi:DUF1836 domain-containing protein [Ornithinibacillus bavariensis]|uniref:DUF1836 domain-containing protein n=1 Tax=Ornithinibacillus bavariensis TaxID=545502 RepID=A0A920C773_9BACI|nr:DUF1836 domain-containing protein [Ornithinibacillus bavariensis]GIO28691.1 hypothetical protein J43TS3_33020 [Ornithinibacillus bavariensis]